MDLPVCQLDAAAIAAAIPHDDPFLFLDSASLEAESASGTYRIRGDEFFLRGHFRENPVFPASIMLEALGQLAVLFLVAAPSPQLAEKQVDPAKIFFHSSDEVRCSRFCRPGDVLDMSVKLKRIRHPRASFQGAITVAGERAAYAEGINLMFDWKA
ncbi:3-hydroxyacyl-ACP dehydratase [Ruficoccus amylovorans]|uniref:3-hydroxyacyl-ACP dehydratase n=1 Tax=Ruficoccus amylovorans TaxID=1804625 RepID=A0A842HME9_9BACT|nr:3-hydroxyacyl-ACP dehydratase [Ruficoccus amylovorans]MBC2596261.1 3-hydroxyacyl-ACP dehydratase [Ruficoccus amylovorans]